MAWTERYVSVTGGGAHDGTTEADAWTLAEAIAAPYAAGQRINVKAGTYANTTTSRTLNIAGTTTAPIWWRGYNTVIGDLDADFTTAKPLITFTTGALTVSGIHQILSNLSIVGTANTAALLVLNAGMCKLHRVRVDAQNANSGAKAGNFTTTGENEITECWFKATTTATEVVTAASFCQFTGCAFEGGGHHIVISNSGGGSVLFCTFNNPGGDGIRMTGGGNLVAFGNSFYSAGSDGIEMTTLPGATNLHLICNNIFSECVGSGINNSTGANTNIIHRARNAYWSNGATETGFGDSPSFSDVTLAADPFTNAAGGDLSIVTGSLAKAAGIPGLFENQSYTSYLDCGAVQIVAGSGSAGLMRSVPMTGGLT